ncbi:MAG: hybrid sensor histidine kinase/response regulator [Deltaproteobacteria bacterium]|nr:hybrid sensor histidine kinase/response regulator [Deltaproteobacteria bacterium]
MGTRKAKASVKLLEIFHAEASENLQQISEMLLEVERDEKERGPRLAEVMKAAHSLKGASGAVGSEALLALMHDLESCVSTLVEDGERITSDNLASLYRYLDLCTRLLDVVCLGASAEDLKIPEVLADIAGRFGAFTELDAEVEKVVAQARPLVAGGGEAAPVQRAVEADGGARSVRVATEKIDRQLADIEELVQLESLAVTHLAEARKVLETIQQWHQALGRTRSLLAKARGDKLRGRAEDELRHLVDTQRELSDDALRLTEALHRDLLTHGRSLEGLSHRLRDDIRVIRMLPVDMVFSPFKRMVRDIAIDQGKKVNLVIRGGETEVDRDLIEVLKAPMNHLVRNAVDHGIEDGETRRAMGKPEEATLELSASSRAGTIEVFITDDGRGLDPDFLREKAISRGLLSKDEAAALDDQQALDLIFHHGFSTAGTITDVSGRGVGLAVVRQAVDTLGGRLSLRSRAGIGTEFRLVLPLSLATLRSLLVKVAGESIAIPVSTVERIVRIEASEIQQVDDGQVIDVGGRPLGVFALAQALELPAEASNVPRRPALVLSTGSLTEVAVVDEIVGEQETVTKPLPEQMRGLSVLSGITVLGTGQIVPIVNVHEMLRSRSGALAPLFRAEEAQQRRRRKILVVDDSITTRTLERSILEAVGYQVSVATNGVEALELLAKESFELVLSDVQMPRMDGLTLVKEIRGIDKLRKLPVVLVSSLAADDDRQRGMQAGASAYLTKGEFRQEDLLEVLSRLL